MGIAGSHEDWVDEHTKTVCHNHCTWEGPFGDMDPVGEDDYACPLCGATLSGGMVLLTDDEWTGATSEVPTAASEGGE